MNDATKASAPRRGGFTLIELMLVIALMGIMGVLAVGSYSAVTRGMSERAALATARALADAAHQRAQIDQAPTYIFLFDEVLAPDTATAAGVVQGVAIAVRTCGRVTETAGGLVCDEFGDLNRSFKSLVDSQDSESESKNKQEAAASTMRIYNLRTRDSAEVEEGVRSSTVSDTDLEEGGDTETVVRWKVYGFKRKSGADFKVGDPYGQEFAVMRLPQGYTFSSSVSMSSTSDVGQKKATGQSVVVVPAGTSQAPSITVYARRPNGGFESIGTTRSVKDAAQQ